MHDFYCLYSLSHSTMVEISVILSCTILFCDILLLLVCYKYCCVPLLVIFNNFLKCSNTKISAVSRHKTRLIIAVVKIVHNVKELKTRILSK